MLLSHHPRLIWHENDAGRDLSASARCRRSLESIDNIKEALPKL
jgi:hypothetical protein